MAGPFCYSSVRPRRCGWAGSQGKRRVERTGMAASTASGGTNEFLLINWAVGCGGGQRVSVCGGQ